MTKDFALAGIRLGYVVGSEEKIACISRVAPAWNVNAYAQAAGLMALKQKDFLKRANAKLRTEKKHLISALEEIGLIALPSSTHYFLINVGHAAMFRLQLLQEHHIQVRDCTSFGLPSFIRISTRTRDENERLINAMKVMRS